MLASVSALLVEAGGRSGGGISQVMNRLEADLTDDGSLNNSPGFSPGVRTQLNNASKSINWITVATNLNGFYKTTAYTAANLRQWSDSSGGVDHVIDRFKFSATDVAVGAESRSPEYIAGSDDVDRCFSASDGTLYRNGVAVTGTVRSAKDDKFTLGLTENQASTQRSGFVQWSTRPASGVCSSTVPTTGLRRVMKYTVNTAAQQITYGQFAAQYAYSGEQPVINAAYNNPNTGVYSTELTQPWDSGTNVTASCSGVSFTRNPDGTGYATSQFTCALVNGKTVVINVTGYVYPRDSVYFTYQCSSSNECSVIGAKSNSEGVRAVQVTSAVGSGIILSKIGPNGGYARSAAMQLDGKIVVAGVAIVENRDNDIAVARYNQDGTLDPNFGISGVATVNVSGRIASTDWARGMVIQNDGKIIVVGYTSKSGEDAYGLLIIRFNSDGTPDPNFGSGGILKFTDSTKNIFGHAIALQSDGKLVIAGAINCINRNTPDYCTLLLRYNIDGTQDPTFNSSGISRADSSTQGAQGMVIQKDGKILVTGAKNNGSSNELSVARYRTDGLIDSTFGLNGIVTVPIGIEVGSSNAGTNIALQPDGKILVSGVASTNAKNNHFSLTRLLPDGAVDFRFGRAGSVVTYVSTPPDSSYAHAIAVQPDGKIILAGEVSIARANTFPFPGFYSQANVNFAMARYTANGILDSSFGTAGLVVTDLNGLDDRGYALALQSNGSIVLAGEAFTYQAGDGYGGFSSFGIARYLVNGSLDANFGNPR